MKFVINKDDLAREVALAHGVAEHKQTIPILSSVLITAKDRQLQLTATDLDTTVRVNTDAAEIEVEGSACLPARKLNEIVRLLPDGPVTIEIDEKQSGTVRCGKFVARIGGSEASAFPEVPVVTERDCAMPASVFCSLVSAVSYAITQEESRYSLQGAKIERSKESLTMVATDGHRLALARRKDLAANGTGAFDVLVPKKALVEAAKLAASYEGDVEIGCGDGCVRFGVGQRELIGRLLTGQFPNYQMVIPKRSERAFVVDAAPFTKALRRVGVMVEARSLAARFTLNDGQLTMKATNSKEGEAIENIPVSYTGDEFEIGFNLCYIQDSVNAAGAEQLRFELGSPESQAVLRPLGLDDQLETFSVIMPMRI